MNGYPRFGWVDILRFQQMRNYLFKVLPLIANLGESKDAIKGKTLNSKSLSNLLIPLPPLQEQQRIIEQMNILSKQLR